MRFKKQGLCFKLLYVDDLVIMAETKKELLVRILMWKRGMETKGLRVNMVKTNIFKCKTDLGSGVSSGKWPCGVCKKGMGSNYFTSELIISGDFNIHVDQTSSSASCNFNLC